MKQTTTIILAFAMLGFSQLNAQNVGIGTATPDAKLDVVQTAGVDAIEVNHSGGTGNSIEINATNGANTSSVIFIPNLSAGTGINLDMANAASAATGIQVVMAGTGTGQYIQHDNDASGEFINMTSATNGFAGLQVNHVGPGYASWLFHSGTGRGLSISHSGTGIGAFVDMSNTANNLTGLRVDHASTGTARGFEIYMPGANNTGMGQGLFYSGRGRGGNISLSNTANDDIAWAVFHAGTVYNPGVSSSIALYGQSAVDGVYGVSTGVNGTPGTFFNTNAAANRNAVGLFVSYSGTGVAGGGGGNTAEFVHGGTNGNVIDVFMGSPAIAPGPANTTSDFSCMNLSHMGTGTAATGYKSAIEASVNGSDPTIVAISASNTARQGILSFANPNGFVDPQGVYGYSYSAANPGYGIGVQGVGGWYGVRGIGNGGAAPTTFAVYGTGDYGGTGAKYFSIDHPLDPANKILNHYSIESNEVTNMYRGIVTLDANGEAIVELPAYFDAANIEPSYQLTAIGTPNQPYVLEEEANNQFKVAGTPNTKVSWTVYAKRNDATLRYFSAQGKNYDQEEVVKPAKMKGKYYTPGAYNQPENMGIHYDAAFEKTLEKTGKVKQTAMPTPTQKSNATRTSAQPQPIKENPNVKEATTTAQEEVTSRK